MLIVWAHNMRNELPGFCKASLSPTNYTPATDMSIGESKQVLIVPWASLELLNSIYPKTQQAAGFILSARQAVAALILIHTTTHLAVLEHRQSETASAYKALWAYPGQHLPALKQINCTCVEMRGWEGRGHSAGLNLHFSVQPWASHSFYSHLNSSSGKLG